jgi:transposase
MQLKTILNRVQNFKSFVYGKVRWVDEATEPTIEAELRPRANGQAMCVGCQRRRPGYDTLPVRRFEFIPMWGIKVFFIYAPRRVSCPDCGIRVERMPWATGKHQLTETYAWFLAGWARRLSWKEVAEAFRTTWDHVFCSVEMAVAWGRVHQDLSGIEAIGVDEIAWQRGHNYLTLVYQIDAECRRLLWIGQERKAKTLLRFSAGWVRSERAGCVLFAAICGNRT